MLPPPLSFFFFFFNDTATTEIYTLSLHDALPICAIPRTPPGHGARQTLETEIRDAVGVEILPDFFERIDRKSTRLNSSHSQISYAVFCLKKKNKLARSLLNGTYDIMNW